MEKSTKDLTAASSIPIILAILASGESYGYEILQKVREASGGQLDWADGMLYPVLHKLENKGLIESRWVTPENGRKRKYYRINSSGRETLETQMNHWETFHQTLQQLWKQTSLTYS